MPSLLVFKDSVRIALPNAKQDLWHPPKACLDQGAKQSHTFQGMEQNTSDGVGKNGTVEKASQE